MLIFLIISALVAIATLICVRFVSVSCPALPRLASDLDSACEAIDEPQLLGPFPLLQTCNPFDDAGALIWRTQIPALRMVCEHELRGVPCADLNPVYLELARRYPEMYDGYTFHDWGQLLVDLDLIRVKTKQAHITRAGRALLEWLVAATPRSTREVALQ